jgi:hypothetical protein
MLLAAGLVAAGLSCGGMSCCLSLACLVTAVSTADSTGCEAVSVLLVLVVVGSLLTCGWLERTGRCTKS